MSGCGVSASRTFWLLAKKGKSNLDLDLKRHSISDQRAVGLLVHQSVLAGCVQVIGRHVVFRSV